MRGARRRAGAIDPTTRAYERLASHRFGWVAEPLVDEASFVLRPMFGCLACYVHGRLVLVLADRQPPWCGVFVPTERDAQPALRSDFPALRPHPILPKWLCMTEEDTDFESIGEAIVRRALANDPLVGVEPKPKRRRRLSGSR